MMKFVRSKYGAENEADMWGMRVFRGNGLRIRELG
jgi:hypothetical protein